MSATLSITETQTFVALVDVINQFGLIDAKGNPLQVVRGQVNRVPSPANPDFAVLWPLSRTRLSFNVATYSDNVATGSISENILTVTAISNGTIPLNVPLYGPNVDGSPIILQQCSGTTGGIGTYAISGKPQTAAIGPIYCGTNALMQPQDFAVQVDIHGPKSGDNAIVLTTQWFDWVGWQDADYGAVIAPLYASDPRQIPFLNDQQQIDERWSIDLHMQINPVTTVTQQFADKLAASVVPANVIPLT